MKNYWLAASLLVSGCTPAMSQFLPTPYTKGFVNGVTNQATALSYLGAAPNSAVSNGVVSPSYLNSWATTNAVPPSALTNYIPATNSLVFVTNNQPTVNFSYVSCGAVTNGAGSNAPTVYLGAGGSASLNNKSGGNGGTVYLGTGGNGQGSGSSGTGGTVYIGTGGTGASPGTVYAGNITAASISGPGSGITSLAQTVVMGIVSNYPSVFFDP